MIKKYIFKKYSKKYPSLFNKEKKKLEKIIPFFQSIEHIGSTSIPELGGKGIIDVLLVLNNKKDMKKAEKLLIKNNYEIMSHVSNETRISFKKFYGFLLFKRRVHIHLTYKNSKTHKETLNFKKKLMKNKKLIKEYIQLKKEAVKIANENGKIYRDYKQKFIQHYSK